MDMGANEYTVGRPHPMIDGTLRKQHILTGSRDPQTAVLLLDFIPGYNASMEPVGELLDAIDEAKQIAKAIAGILRLWHLYVDRWRSSDPVLAAEKYERIINVCSAGQDLDHENGE